MTDPTPGELFADIMRAALTAPTQALLQSLDPQQEAPVIAEDEAARVMDAIDAEHNHTDPTL